ncbi:hypothetical protein A9G29_03035 [Gilliamella sp. Fer2-1]|nr:hypothetical protein A9G29_03035 [Gilliamella apicola]
MLKNKSKQKTKKSRQEINEESRELKRKRKHKGLPSGSRFNNQENNKNKNSTKTVKDPRVGSKKPISLIAETSSNVTQAKQPTKPAKMVLSSNLSPQQELEQLENDPKLDKLLDLVEQNSKLTKEQQTYLDSKLNRIDELMQQLGYTDDDFDDIEDQDDKKEDIVSLLKRN